MHYAGTTTINYRWYIRYTVNSDQSITIHAHFRKHLRDTGHPDTEGREFEIEEDSDRNAIGVWIGPKLYPIANVMHVFSYPHA